MDSWGKRLHVVMTVVFIGEIHYRCELRILANYPSRMFRETSSLCRPKNRDREANKVRQKNANTEGQD
jgi:hypothetical protein